MELHRNKATAWFVVQGLLTYPVWLLSKECLVHPIPYQKHGFVEYVCVCVRERERENGRNLLEIDKEDTGNPTMVKRIGITAGKIPHSKLVELQQLCIDQHRQRSRLEQSSHHG